MLLRLCFDIGRLALGIVKLDNLIVEPDIKHLEADRNLQLSLFGSSPDGAVGLLAFYNCLN